jgi:hypothetical protein
MVGAAVVVVLMTYLTARFVTGTRGPNSPRLAGMLVIYLVVWLLIASQSTSTAASIAGYGAGGVTEAVSGAIHFLNDVLSK